MIYVKILDMIWTVLTFVMIIPVSIFRNCFFSVYTKMNTRTQRCMCTSLWMTIDQLYIWFCHTPNCIVYSVTSYSVFTLGLFNVYYYWNAGLRQLKSHISWPRSLTNEDTLSDWPAAAFSFCLAKHSAYHITKQTTLSDHLGVDLSCSLRI